MKGSIKKKGRRARQKRHFRQHRKSMLAVSFVILLLVIVVSVGGVTLRAKEKAYEAQEAELEQQIAEEKARAAEIDELEEYVGTDAYVEEVAKDKLGLVNENEIIFRAK